MTTTVPFGAVMITVILLTLVFVFGTDTVPTIGVTLGANGIVTEALVDVKSMPGPPGTRSSGEVLFGEPVNIGLLISCGEFMPETFIS